MVQDDDADAIAAEFLTVQLMKRRCAAAGGMICAHLLCDMHCRCSRVFVWLPCFVYAAQHVLVRTLAVTPLMTGDPEGQATLWSPF